MSVAGAEVATQISSGADAKNDEVLTLPLAELAAQELFDVHSPASREMRNGDVCEQVPQRAESFLVFCLRSFRELTYIKFALTSFIVNGLRRRYQRSVLGFAWSLLNPILTMVILTLVFSLLFKSNPRTFAIHIFTGLLPWTFISESIALGCTAIVGAEHFLKKVYIPKLFFPLVTVATEAINFAFSLVALLFLGLIFGMKVGHTILLLPVVIGITFVFSFGLCLATAVSTVYFRDLTHLVRVLLTSFFYLIPIMYPLSCVPAEYQKYFALNPFTHFINLFRCLIYDRSWPDQGEWLTCIALAAGSMLIGLVILYKREKDLIFRL